MRRAILPLLFLVSLAVVLLTRDPFGWQFNLGLLGAWATALMGWARSVRRLLKSPRKAARVVGYVFTSATAVLAVVVAILMTDYHRLVFKRATTAAWASDIRDLRSSIDRLPPGLAARARVTMAPELIGFEEDLPSLNEDQRQARLTRAVAALADGHSAAFPFMPATDFTLVPIRLKFFEDGLFVIDAAGRHHDLIGQEVVRIAGLDVAQALATIRPYVSADNDSAARERSAYYMLSPRFWRAVGLAVDPDRLDIAVRTPQGEQRVQLAPVSRWRSLWWLIEPRSWLLPPKPSAADAPSFEWRREPWWITLLPNDRAVYVPFRAVRQNGKETLTAFGKRLIDTARAANAERIVIDVRENSGGDNTLFRGFIKAIADSEFNTRGRLMLLIGGGTFSAATNFVSAMERDTNVTLVGEPTGSGPNHFGDAAPHKLAGTGVMIFLSTRYHQFGAADDRRLAHDPQISVENRSADYFARRDRVLEAALRHR